MSQNHRMRLPEWPWNDQVIRLKNKGFKMASKPSSFKKLMVHELTTDFRKAVKIESVKMCQPQKEHVCIKVKYVGINASDVIVTNGTGYHISKTVPFGIGFEAVGEIVELGESVEELKVEQSVAFINPQTYAEYVCVPAKEVFPIPEATPRYLTMLVSGLTAAISLDKSGRITAGETVIITAAAGGTGHLAVQWAKAAECHVIATCSSKEKEDILKELGCDRIINYKKENVAEVLAKEYPKGVDVIWETVGGQMLVDCVKNLAVKGRLITVGSITGYKTEGKKDLPKLDASFLLEQLLYKSAAVQGFLFFSYKECFPTYFKYLCDSVQSKKLKPLIDTGISTAEGEFVGMEGIIRGVEYLHSGKNIGKVVSRIS
ncbi:hypothetical protein JTE90_027953 [Oedothorax gibbosus]|uniref:15-oxoprostaglandin 13-reductase n=1 Tax=Oedothorax gibbosus TaxID=931172 RepID=A0AAV6VEI2_9ARAC|nr:hypothetical protein JTE90_027953 [Oedothorax gibbosus]